jgi:thioredoxin reductase (NADPH)
LSLNLRPHIRARLRRRSNPVPRGGDQDSGVELSPSRIEHERLVIIGSGPAAYTAAIYAARALLKPLVLAGFEQGGQLMTTTDVENYPGFADSIQGPWLMEQMRAQAENVGVRVENEYVVGLEVGQRPFVVRCDSGRKLAAEAIILATGAKAKWLGLASEEAFKGFGVSACATCDGFFFRGKTVAVIGGGNTAVEEALHLSNIAAHVTVVHRRDSFRAEKILRERLASRHNVSIRWNSAVESILGGGTPPGVTGLRVRNVVTGALDDLAVDGVFVAIGHEPATELVRGQVALKANGYVQTTPGSTATSVEGVFAAGDVADDVFRQAVTAAGLGCMAALEAERWLAAQVPKQAAAE